MLWTAIAALQRSDPDIVSVVYSGDIDASKEEIIDKVKVLAIAARVSFQWLIDRPALGTVRDCVGPCNAPFCVSTIAVFGGGFYLATFHATRTEPRIHVPCLGGNV